MLATTLAKHKNVLKVGFFVAKNAAQKPTKNTRGRPTAEASRIPEPQKGASKFTAFFHALKVKICELNKFINYLVFAYFIIDLSQL